MELGDIRRDYRLGELGDSGLPEDPLSLFSQWIKEARQSANPEPTAMTLSTTGAGGALYSRMVLLKKVEDDRFLFFTNYEGRKARHLEDSPEASLHFFWPELERQVNISGQAFQVGEKVSDQYFASRPYESRIAAWASPQSDILSKREQLAEAFEKYRKLYPESKAVPRPPHWGGIAVRARRMEFWQGGPHRLHDRIEYRREGQRWTRVRLAP